jgi:hypothetical protein
LKSVCEYVIAFEENLPVQILIRRLPERAAANHRSN